MPTSVVVVMYDSELSREPGPIQTERVRPENPQDWTEDDWRNASNKDALTFLDFLTGVVSFYDAIIERDPGGLAAAVFYARVPGGKLVKLSFAKFKSEAKWASQLRRRGWTSEQISEAISSGQSFRAENLVNRGNTATRFVHPRTGRSVVIDDITKEVIHVGGDGFRY